MKISNKGIELIKKFEGCKLAAYRCPAGTLTIGYGHTGDVKEGQTITAEYAETLLRADLVKYELKVSKYDPQYNWNQNEFDALVSFAYNVGNIDQLTDRGNRSRETIAEKMLQYNKAGGKVLSGLTKRRNVERELFLASCDKTAGNGTGQSQNGIVEYSVKQDGEKQISKNFQVKEFRCKDGTDRLLVDVDFVRDKLQSIRDHFDAPVTINSAYRTVSWNKKQGGASKSYHLAGQAFDIVVQGHIPQEVAQYAQRLGIKGIIQYNGFVHVDSRTVKYWARDDNGKKTKVNNF